MPRFASVVAVLTLLFLLELPRFSDTKKICSGNYVAAYTSYSLEVHHERLRKALEHCTHIIGSVSIQGLRRLNDSLPEPLDLEFLRSIEEISGTLHIDNNCVETIPLTNLRIIRGERGNDVATSKIEAKTLTVYNVVPMSCIKPTIIDMRNLRHIGVSKIPGTNENVFPIGMTQASACYMGLKVNFKELLPFGAIVPSDKTAITNLYCNTSRPEVYVCHSSCPIWKETGKRHCWGPNVDQCQSQSKCREISSTSCPQGLCYTDENDHEHCCNEQCIAGCFGSSSKQCIGCRRFDKNGTCVSDCRPNLYNPGTQEIMNGANLTEYFPLASHCLTQCVGTFYKQEKSCVKKCAADYHLVGKECIKNTVNQKSCELKSADTLICNKNNELLSDKPCVIFHGFITISEQCFKHSEDPNMRKLTVNDLYKYLGQLKEVHGGVSVMTTNFTQLTNLTFFKSLETIYFSNGKTSSSQSSNGMLVVVSKYVKFLGTSKLRYVDAGIMFLNTLNPKKQKTSEMSFCPKLFPTIQGYNQYLKKNKENVIISGRFRTLLYRNIGNIESGKFVNARCQRSTNCDRQCNATYGCWGPRISDCLICQNYKLNDSCVSDCGDFDGWYFSNISGIEMYRKLPQKHCQRCHSQCKRCKGNLLSDCLECMNVKENGVCKSKCSPQNYPDENNVCQPCHESCYHSLDLPRVCTGPRGYVMKGGCTLCTNFIEVRMSDLDSTKVLRCMNKREKCPSGYYETIAKDKYLQKFPYYYNSYREYYIGNVGVCQKCSDHCLTCESGSECTTCRFYTIETGNSGNKLRCSYSNLDRSNEKCPEGTFMNTTSRYCSLCHSACKNCNGASNKNCLSCNGGASRIYHGELYRSNFSCVNSCPESMFKRIGDDNILLCLRDMDEFNKEQAKKTMELERTKKFTAVTSGIVLLVVVVLAIAGGFVCYWWRQKILNTKRKLDEGFDFEEEFEPLYTTSAEPNMAHLRIIKENELIRGPEIGAGAFGTVYRGEWIPESQSSSSHKHHVAIKLLNDADSTVNTELLEETKIMASADHPNVVRIVGICLTHQIQLVSQFLPLGNLRDFLRSKRDTGNIGSSHLLRYAVQIASGMNYLESKNIIHRDLACRNVLVQSLKCVKITDFGLARHLDNPGEEYKASGGKLPVKWLALECLVSRKFSHKSDVWAYGVTLWEIFMFGEQPYPNVRPRDLADYLEKGERLAQPPICTLDIYMLLIKCWMLNEAHRPSFAELEMEFKKYASEPGRYVFIKGDKYARNPSNESNKVEDDGHGHVASGANVDEYLNSTMDGPDRAVNSDSDNDVFTADEHLANSTLPLRTTKRQVHHTPSFNSGAALTSGPFRGFKKKPFNISDEHIINKYTSDPCKLNDKPTCVPPPVLPAPPPPLPPDHPTLQRGTSPLVSSESDEDYLKPRTIQSRTSPSREIPQIVVKPSDSVKPKNDSDSSPLIVASPTVLTSPTVQNPEYFFNQKQYENGGMDTWTANKLALTPSVRSDSSTNPLMSDSQV